jgi:hypothetical protein
MAWASDSVEGLGWFWEAGPSEVGDQRQVPGRLTANSDSQSLELLVRTETHDELRRLIGRGAESSDVRRSFHGQVGNHRVTVLNAVSAGTSYNSTVSALESHRPSIVLEGANLPLVLNEDGGCTTLVDAVVGSFDLLSEWAALGGLTASTPLSGGWPNGVTVDYEVPAVVTAPMPGGRIELQPEWIPPALGSSTEVSISTRAVLRVVWDEPHDLEDALGSLGAVQALLSLVGAGATDVLGVKAHHAACRVRDSERELYDPVRVIVSWSRRRPEQAAPFETQIRRGRGALITFEEFGGVAGLARWLDVYEASKLAVGMLMAPIYAHRMPAENRFMNTCGALEALHREWHPLSQAEEDAAATRRKEIIDAADRADRDLLKRALRYAHEPALDARIRGLGSAVPNSSSALVGDLKHWSAAVSFVRNRIAHPPDAAQREKEREAGVEGPDGEIYLYLTRSVRWFAIATLLHRVGVSDAILAEALSTSELHQVRYGVEKVMERWSPNSKPRGFTPRRQTA